MKIQGWEKSLAEVVRKHKDAPFGWDGSNCVSMIIDAYVAQTGDSETYAWMLEGITSEEDYAARLEKLGAGTLSDALANHLEEVPPSFAQRGDICVIKLRGEDFGAVMIDGFAYGKSRTGVMRCDRTLVKRAFRIP